MFNTRHPAQSLLRHGIYVGFAGGLAEVAVVCSYTAMTGRDAAVVGRGIAAAVGLAGAPAWAGLAIHMGLAAALGAGLCAVFRAMGGSRRPTQPLEFMLGSLAAVWAVNFFVVLPLLSPGFVHILPYSVTLASKLAFGLAAAGMMRRRATSGSPGGRAGSFSRLAPAAH